MNQQLATRIAAALGFLAVALGAFGAHGLKDLLAQNGTAAIWEKAVMATLCWSWQCGTRVIWQPQGDARIG